MGEMIRVRQEHGGSVLLAIEVEPSQVSNYGVFDVEVTDVIALLISEGHPGHVVVHDGIRHDLGNPPASFPPASNSASATRSTGRHCSMTWKQFWKTTGWSETRRRRR